MLDQAKAALLASYHKIELAVLPDEVERRRKDFLNKYAPERLINLAGNELLEAVHGSESRRGLFYDLEFAELYSPFGNIGGGSALKFKVYSAADGSGYKKKGPGNKPVSCSKAEAERMTANIVAMLYRAWQAAEETPLPAGDPEIWRAFERVVTSNSPPSLAQFGHDSPVALLGWAHKYLAICRPDIFSFHHQAHQLANHLVRLGEALEGSESRYLLDRQWYAVRNGDPEIRACHPVLLMKAAYDCFGNETKYWRIGTDEHDEQGPIDRWPVMQQGSFASIGWNFLGNLKDMLAGLEGQPARERIKQALSAQEEDLQKPAPLLSKWAAQIYDFYAALTPGDRVVAMRGRQFLSVGEIVGEYEYDSSDIHPHHRRVFWHELSEETWPDPPGLQTTLCNFTRRYADAVRAETLLLTSNPQSATSNCVIQHPETSSPFPDPVPAFRSLPPVEEIPLTPFDRRIRDILERKGQVIFYGPPGTGKTYHARQTARELIAREVCRGQTWERLNPQEKRLVDEAIEFITFHPAYAYEDFIEGYRPAAEQKAGAAFELRDGIFLELCNRARQNPGRHQILIIDEINRGNLAAILGELITLLESDKRETLAAVLPLSRRRFRIPRNVWILGTMNTADRSISLLDTALRRRFGFVEMLPEPEHIDVNIDGLSLSALLTEINARIRRHIPRNARELQIGHAYLMRDGQPLQTREHLLAAFRDELLPLLAEYCFENYGTLAQILGPEIVDTAGQVPSVRVLSDADRLHKALQRLLSVEPVRRTGLVYPSGRETGAVAFVNEPGNAFPAAEETDGEE